MYVYPCIGVIPQKGIFNAWARGDDGVPFPTLTAARTYIKLGAGR
jgi:hypothetical protein